MPNPILTGLLTIAMLIPMREAVALGTIAASPTKSTTAPKAMTSTWKKFTATQGRYTILMPGKPQTIAAPLTLPQGITLKMWITASQETPNTNTSYIASYMDFPASGVMSENLGQAALDAGIQNLLKNGNRREISRSRFTLEGYPGQEVHYRAPKNMAGRVRVFMVENRLYVVGVETDQEAANQQKITNFLQSFKLL